MTRNHLHAIPSTLTIHSLLFVFLSSLTPYNPVREYHYSLPKQERLFEAFIPIILGEYILLNWSPLTDTVRIDR